MRSIARRIAFLLPAGARVPAATAAAAAIAPGTSRRTILCLLAFTITTTTSLPIEAQPLAMAPSLPSSPEPFPTTRPPVHAKHFDDGDGPWTAAHPSPPQVSLGQQSKTRSWSDGTIAGFAVGLFVILFLVICGGYLLLDRRKLWLQRQRRRERQKKLRGKSQRRQRSGSPENSRCQHWIDEKRWHAQYTGYGDWWTPGASLTYIGKLESGHMFPPHLLRPYYINEEEEEYEEDDDEEQNEEDNDGELYKTWFYSRHRHSTTASHTAADTNTTITSSSTSSSLPLTPPPVAIGGGLHDNCCSPLYTIREYASSDSSLASWLECPPIPQTLQQQENWHQSSFEEDVDAQSRPPPVYLPSSRPVQAMCYHQDGHQHLVYGGNESASVSCSSGLFSFERISDPSSSV